ncbi:MAG: FHA domain-containing protein, partial [Pseudomonas sp.]
FLKGDVLEVKDLASANGVLVNGEKRSAAVLQPGDQVRMGSVTLLVIGPKVESQQVEDEDATLFMQAVDLPKPAPKAVNPAATPNPLRAAAQASVAPAPVEAAGTSRVGLLLVGVLLIAAVAAAILLV